MKPEEIKTKIPEENTWDVLETSQFTLMLFNEDYGIKWKEKF